MMALFDKRREAQDPATYAAFDEAVRLASDLLVAQVEIQAKLESYYQTLSSLHDDLNKWHETLQRAEEYLTARAEMTDVDEEWSGYLKDFGLANPSLFDKPEET